MSNLASISAFSLLGSVATFLRNYIYLSVCVAYDIEVRSYEKVGADMEWHVDDTLYDPPQIEVVLKLENTSDCVKSWKEDELRQKQIETDGNSVILLWAGGVEHSVSAS